MKKLIGLLIVTGVLFLYNACEKNNDNYVGVWKNNGHYGTLTLEITKNSEAYSIIHSHNKPGDEHSHSHKKTHDKNKEGDIQDVHLKNDTLHFSVNKKPQTATLNSEKTALTAFGRIYKKQE